VKNNFIFQSVTSKQERWSSGRHGVSKIAESSGNLSLPVILVSVQQQCWPGQD